MTAIPQPQTPDEDDAYFRAILIDLVDQGARLAARLVDHATAATTQNPEPDPALAYERIARSIRYTIALARHLKAAPSAPRPEPTPEPN